MASLWGKLEARIVVPTGGWTDSGNFTLTESAGGGAQDITITAGNYWWNTGDGGSTFLAQIKADLEAASANTLTYTVSLDDSEGGTGQLTIGVSSGTATINFGSGDGLTFYNLIGANNDPEVYDSGFAMDNQVQALWMPECPYNAEFPPAGSSKSGANAGTVVAQTAMSMAPDGTYRLFVGDTHVRNRIFWETVNKGKVWVKNQSGSGSELTNSSFEQFWDDAVLGTAAWASTPGYQIRFYPDTTIQTGQPFNITNPQVIPATRIDANYEEWWRVELEVAQ